MSIPNDPHIKECLVDFIHLERATAAVIASKILESLTNVSLSLNPSNIRGQAYDGAAVMSSEKAGVQAKIKEVSPLTFYTHCYCHCLNLSLASACQLQEIRNLIGIINEAFLFLSNSAKRQRYFEKVLELYLPTCSQTKIVGLCKTRWVERHTCFEVFLEMYMVFVTSLDAMLHPHQHSQLGTNDSWDWDRDTLVKAQGMMAALTTFQNIAVFIITLDILKGSFSQIAEARSRCAMIDDVMESLASTRTTIDTGPAVARKSGRDDQFIGLRGEGGWGERGGGWGEGGGVGVGWGGGGWGRGWGRGVGGVGDGGWGGRLTDPPWLRA